MRTALFTLLLAVGCTAPGLAQAASGAIGRNLYETSCSSCHGLDLRGTPLGPSLQQVGRAATDFMLVTGRMPLADPTQQDRRQPTTFSPAQITALEDYIAHVAPGGPPIPYVALDTNLQRGRMLFMTNCAACHGADGRGATVGFGQYAPSLMYASVVQVAEAARVGPGEMPRFSPQALPDRDLNSIAHFVNVLQTAPLDPGGFALHDIGPVAEGMVAWFIGAAGLIGLVRIIGTSQ